MDKKETFSKIEYVVACVGAFAQRYKLILFHVQPKEISFNLRNMKDFE